MAPEASQRDLKKGPIKDDKILKALVFHMAERFGNDLVLLERIAAGGMAEVYRAKQLGLAGFEKTIGVKRILPNYAQNEEFKAMFREEANLSGLLQHQNIVQIYGNGEFNDYLFLTMEFVDGKNVRQVLARADKKKARIPVEFALYIISEAAKGLDYAHNYQDEKTGEVLEIVHRDMSPQNIMLSYDGAVKIVDFGIAKAAARSGQTKAGVLKGKFGYMSPEQAQGLALDRRTDVFALGIILFELLTQRRLFTSDDDLRTLQLVKDCRVPRPSKYNPDVSQTLDGIVLKALKKEKAERYSSGNELYVDLIRYLYQKYPKFLPTDLSKFLRDVFSEDIVEEKKKRDKSNAEMPTREELNKMSAAAAPPDQSAINQADAGDRTKVSQVTSPTEGRVQAKASQEQTAQSDFPQSDEFTGRTSLAGGENTKTREHTPNPLNAAPSSPPMLAASSGLPPPRPNYDSEMLKRQLQKPSKPMPSSRKKTASTRRFSPAAMVAVVVLASAGIYKYLDTSSRAPTNDGTKKCETGSTWDASRNSCVLTPADPIQPGPGPTVPPKEDPPPVPTCKTGQKWDPLSKTCLVIPMDNPSAVWILVEEPFQPSGTLNLAATPQADFVSINGKQIVGKDMKPLKTPIKSIRLKPGTYRIKVKNDFFGLFKEENITIEADRISEIDLLMK